MGCPPAVNQESLCQGCVLEDLQADKTRHKGFPPQRFPKSRTGLITLCDAVGYVETPPFKYKDLQYDTLHFCSWTRQVTGQASLLHSSLSLAMGEMPLTSLQAPSSG